jgi:hypothetical protein
LRDNEWNLLEHRVTLREPAHVIKQVRNFCPVTLEKMQLKSIPTLMKDTEICCIKLHGGTELEGDLLEE